MYIKKIKKIFRGIYTLLSSSNLLTNALNIHHYKKMPLNVFLQSVCTGCVALNCVENLTRTPLFFLVIKTTKIT